MPIEGLTKNTRYRQEECTIIGMVVEVKTTTNGHRIAEIEDTSGTIPVLFRKDRPVFSDAERIIHDEVIGVKGKLSSDGKLFFAEPLYRPDIRIDNAPFKSEQPGKAVFISDVHVGSDTFLQASWNNFADWLCGLRLLLPAHRGRPRGRDRYLPGPGRRTAPSRTSTSSTMPSAR